MNLSHGLVCVTLGYWITLMMIPRLTTYSDSCPSACRHLLDTSSRIKRCTESLKPLLSECRMSWIIITCTIVFYVLCLLHRLFGACPAWVQCARAIQRLG